MEPDYTQTRSRLDVIVEHFGVRTHREARVIMDLNRTEPLLPASNYSKLKLPYEASSHPRIPTISEFAQGMKDNPLSRHYTHYLVCRVGATVVKMGDEAILHVRSSIILGWNNLLYFHVTN